MYKQYLKRIFDFSLSLLGLLFVSPLLIIIWIILLVTNNGAGAFFVQSRPGKGGKLFNVIKFKTMNNNLDSNGNLLPDSSRLTLVGKIIRSLSIDELPQLINVLKGDMSLVGPRPLLASYLPLYNSDQAKRHQVKPGITGWAQVNGRNAISWEQKFEYDLWYVDNLSLWLDIKILLLTFKRVLIREGINASESVTMDYFQGTKEKK